MSFHHFTSAQNIAFHFSFIANIMGSNCHVGFSSSLVHISVVTANFLMDRDFYRSCFITLYHCFKEFIANVLEGTVYPGSRQVNSLLNPQPSTIAIGRKSSTTKSTIAVFISLLQAKEHLFTLGWTGKDVCFIGLSLSSPLSSLFALQYSLGALLLSDASGC